MSEHLGQQLLRWEAYRTRLEQEGAKALRDADNHFFPWFVVVLLIASTAGVWGLKVGDGYVFSMLGAVIVTVAHFLLVDRWRKNRIRSDYACRLKEADAQIEVHRKRIEMLWEQE